MNADRANRFRPAQQDSRDIFQNRNRLWSVSSENLASQEIVMASSRTRPRISLIAFASAVVTSLSATAALASQGPGGGPGTASSFTQLAMAIIVYGVSAVVVAAGLIGAARRRLHESLFRFDESKRGSRFLV
jgi:hypothetical protein